MSTAVDVFLSATDSLPFPDILLDIDIKSEIDTLVGGHNDFSGFDFDDLPPAASSSFDMEADTSAVSTHHDIGWSDQSSSMDFGSSEDDGGGGAARGGGGRAAAPRMVNPNAVMPFMTSLAQGVRSPSPLKESHLTFSPATIKITSVKPEVTTIKKDLTTKLEEVVEKRPVLKAVTRVTPILAKPVVKTMVKPPTIVTFRNTMTTTHTNNSRQVSSPMRINHVNTVSSVRTVSSVPTSRKATNPRDHQVYLDVGERVYPKPGFSYSCLIAMALKNSRSGSLPVSEIYNFMCFHFPYFKTAPNGWKNSVRHNLSLNKCFEKIEKPALNGAQRKGCLWAMNPAKISKMDDEMQKITTKDPHSIKRAMTNPENLEMLERGEMKFASSYDESDNFGDSCGGAEEQGEPSDSEHEQEIEVETTNQYQFFRVEQAEDDTCDPDVEVSEEIGYEEMEDDRELLRVEMALAQKELLQYERTHNNKRRRTFFVQRWV